MTQTTYSRHNNQQLVDSIIQYVENSTKNLSVLQKTELIDEQSVKTLTQQVKKLPTALKLLNNLWFPPSKENNAQSIKDIDLLIQTLQSNLILFKSISFKTNFINDVIKLEENIISKLLINKKLNS